MRRPSNSASEERQREWRETRVPYSTRDTVNTQQLPTNYRVHAKSRPVVVRGWDPGAA